MEQIQERVTHRTELGQHQFGGIGGPLPRATQSGLAQPLGDSLPCAFGSCFDLGEFVGSQPRGDRLGAEARLRLFTEGKTGLRIGLNAGTTHWEHRLVAYAALGFTATKHRNRGSQEVLALQRVYVIDARKQLVTSNRHRSIPRSSSDSPNLLTQ